MLLNWSCWRKLLRVPWTIMSSNQSTLKEISPQPWIFTGRTDAEAETLILWPPNAKNWLRGKSPDPGEDWRQKEKGTTQDQIVGWHHWLDGHEFEQSSSDWWWTGKPGVLQSMGSQRIRHNWATELNWTERTRCMFLPLNKLYHD